MFEVVCVSKGSKLYLNGGMPYQVYAVNKAHAEFTQFLLFVDDKWEWHDVNEFIPATIGECEF
jgi:hypothetical protein